MSVLEQKFGEFTIIEKLGQGAMGAVFKARQMSLNRIVALKLLPGRFGGDSDSLSRFKNEAMAAASLNHPNIVQVYAAGEDHGTHYFAMEYVEGESLGSRLERKGRIEPQEAVAIACHLVRALNYAWKKAQVIHRDIKPDNIFLSHEGDVKLGDLGLVKMLGEQDSRLTQTGAAMGTPYYVSPEQALGAKEIDFRTDVYSLGCTLFHALTGTTPYQGESAMSVMMQHVVQPPPKIQAVWPGCPLALAELLGRMLCKRPEERHESYEALQQQLFSIAEFLDQPGSAVSVGASLIVPIPADHSGPTAASAASQQDSPSKGSVAPTAPRFGRRGKILLSFAVAVAVVLALLAWRHGKKPEPKLERSAVTAGEGVAASDATKDAPFVNSLGMKFVPVPIAAGQRVLFSVWDTQVQDYETYATVKKVNDAWKNQTKDAAPLGRGANHPVVGVSWEDAQAFCQWLTEKELAEGRIPKGMKYRLPMDEEWSWAAGMPPETGPTPAAKSAINNVDYPWGKGYPPRQRVGNYADAAYHARFPLTKNETTNRTENLWIEGYDDGYATTSPVGSFPPNVYGLYDMGGNVWQWCEDWFDASQKDHALRGASWDDLGSSTLLLSHRTHNGFGAGNFGFRCVLAPETRDMFVREVRSKENVLRSEKPDNVTHPGPADETKKPPFVNSLGMKFVSVPGVKVMVSIWDTRVQDYEAYAAARNVDDSWTRQAKDGVPSGRELNHPVVGVNWDDAQAFCQWLTQKEIAEGKLSKGLKYRLPTDEEWSWAAGMPLEIGSTPSGKSAKNNVDFPWGKDYPLKRKVGNYADEAFHAKFPPKEGEIDDWNKNRWIEGYSDGYATTSPVGIFPANAYGLYDMGGNVWQWCEDWFDASQEERVLRGGSWDNYDRPLMLSSPRLRFFPSRRGVTLGFRCVLAAENRDVSVRDVIGKESIPRSEKSELVTRLGPADATKESPFVNALDMKFVPVAGTKVLFSIWDTRVQDYAVYARSNDVNDSWKMQQKDGVPFGREPTEPVCGVNWEESKAFCAWLTQMESLTGKLPKGAKYRLPTDEEWSIAVSLPPEQGVTPAEKASQNHGDVFPWGADFPPKKKAGNYADSAYGARFPNSVEKPIEGYTDGFATSSPVGSFPANSFGLYDMGGNVWQWCEDWYDGSQRARVLRGASWNTEGRGAISLKSRLFRAPSARNYYHPYSDYGFRCVLEFPRAVEPVESGAKAASFVNTLEMKFVPVQGTNVLFSIWDTRVRDYAEFAKVSRVDEGWKSQARAGIPISQGPEYPVVAVSWEEAKEFCQWLTAKERAAGKIPEGKSYRLPTQEEWSTAVGAGKLETSPGATEDEFPWGKDFPPPPYAGNYADAAFHEKFPGDNLFNGYKWIVGFTDGFATTSPVGSFPANRFGLYDMGGNVWQWCEDAMGPSKDSHGVRGGSWMDTSRGNLLSSSSPVAKTGSRYDNYGFRCVLAPETSARPASASLGRGDPSAPSSATPPVQKFAQATPPASTAPAASAPTPTSLPNAKSDTEKWLAQVDASYQAMYRREVSVPFENETAELKKSYLDSLERESARTNGSDALAFRNERQRVRNGSDIPSDDRDNPPIGLKPLRTAYRIQSARVESDRRKHTSSVFAQYDKVLTTYETAFTQRQRLDEARMLRQWRDALAKQWNISVTHLLTPL